MTTNNLSSEKNKSRKTSHRFRIVSKEEINKYVKKSEEKLGFYSYDILSMECSCGLATRFYEVQYLDEIKQKLITERFRKSEIDIADILLDNPKYTIYNDKMPILKAESDIGKAYIIGCKKQ